MRSYIEKTESLMGFFYDEPAKVISIITYGNPGRDGAKEAYTFVEPVESWEEWSYLQVERFDPKEFHVIKRCK
jgi:hypothetical protein